ncbi:hypothetical protein [Flavobacterium aestivum]|uniref:hypothetical protein n=1 Tax=Flavobacterium aestivum TaxID=3003257 RepID=UPI0024830F24|nr:hypothetical protein [Flavobacterium aestivum]
MTEFILKKWEEQKILGGLNCFVNNKGEVILLDCFCYKTDNEQFNSCTPFCDTKIENLEKYNNELWTQFDVFTNKVETEDGDMIFGGEGEMGNEGFIVCTNKDNDFIWSLFFLNSNPFYKLELINNEIHAFSSLDLVYKINLKKPENINISHYKWR